MHLVAEFFNEQTQGVSTVSVVINHENPQSLRARRHPAFLSPSPASVSHRTRTVGVKSPSPRRSPRFVAPCRSRRALPGGDRTPLLANAGGLPPVHTPSWRQARCCGEGIADVSASLLQNHPTPAGRCPAASRRADNRGPLPVQPGRCEPSTPDDRILPPAFPRPSLRPHCHPPPVPARLARSAWRLRLGAAASSETAPPAHTQQDARRTRCLAP